MTYEVGIRLTIFTGVFALMAVWEVLAPRRQLLLGRGVRWPSNIGIVVLDTALVRVLFPMGAVAVALWCEAAGYGVMNVLAMPHWLAVPLAVIVMDLVVYGQHVMFHAVPMLWRLHRMHHADTEFDVTTGARFHPIEIVASMVIKIGVVAILGAPAIAVLIFEVLLNATSMFNHSNVRMALWLDRIVRLFVVTPDMHRVHHSIETHETHSNFGFNMPWWDRLFGTYRGQPEAGHDGMTIGLPVFRDFREQRLDNMLTQPFREPTTPLSTGPLSFEPTAEPRRPNA